jgi:WD40 repeat protein
MQQSRRTFLRGAASAFALAAVANGGRKAIADTLFTAATLNWPSRALKLAADPDQYKPPVVTALRIHKDGRWLATAGDDHIVRIWSMADGSRLHRLANHTDWVRSVDYSPDGLTLVSAGNDRRIILWDAASGELRGELPRAKEAVAIVRYSHSGQSLVAAGFEQPLRVFDTASGEVAQTLDGTCRDMRAVAWSPDDQTLAAGGRCGKIRLYEAASGSGIRDIAAHQQRIRSLAFSPDGAYLASTGEDRTIHIVPMLQGAEDYRLPIRPAKYMALAFYGPHHLAAAGSDNLVRLWDVAQQIEIGILAGHTGTIAALDCSGKVLASAGYDTTVRIWTITENLAADGKPVERVGTRPGEGTKTK